MSAEIVQFPKPPEGNGALEVVRDYFDRIHPARAMARMLVDKSELKNAMPDADYFLLHLAAEGFIVVPMR